MNKYTNYLPVIKTKLLKAINHLEYSFNKIQMLSTDATSLDEEGLETWESFSARFSRVAELFLVRFIKTYVKQDDPGFSGTFRDYLNQAEKLDLITDIDTWLQIREMRNITAHEYEEKDLTAYFSDLKKYCPILLKLKKIIEDKNAH